MIEKATEMVELAMSNPGNRERSAREIIDGDDDGMDISTSPIPLQSTFSAMFPDLEKISFICNLTRVAVLLYRAKREFQLEPAKRASRVTQLLVLITELWGAAN